MIVPPPFEEAEHPRAPAGSDTGGQFVAKGGAVETGVDVVYTESALKRKTARELADIAEGFPSLGERDIYELKGGPRRKEILVANILQAQAEMQARETGLDTTGESAVKEFKTEGLSKNVFFQQWKTPLGVDLRAESFLQAYEPDARMWSAKGSVDQIREQGAEAVLAIGRMTGNEHGVAFQVKGDNTTGNETPVMSLGGERYSVNVPIAAVRELSTEGSNWEYDHYHPLPLPLSISDIAAMNAMPGVDKIWEHDESGGWSAASLPKRTSESRGQWEPAMFRSMMQDVDERIRGAVTHYSTGDKKDDDFLYIHARNIGLEKANFIKYEYGLSDTQKAIIDNNKQLFGYIQKQVDGFVNKSIDKYASDLAWHDAIHMAPPHDIIMRKTKEAA